MHPHSNTQDTAATYPVSAAERAEIAVIVVNYNGGAYLRDCLDSLMRQTLRPKRILVMDNASTDGSLEACEGAFPGIEFHRMGANLGFARANNVAAELCSDCEWLALLNPDACAEPDWLARLADAAARHTDIAMFACCMRSALEPERIDDSGLAYNTFGIAWPRYRGSLQASLSSQPREVFAPSGGAAMYKRSAFVAAGGFDEHFFCYYEDVDLGFRLRLLGHRCLLLMDAVVYHFGSALTGGQHSNFSVYHAHRNMVWTFVKNMPAAYLWRYLPMHLLTNMVIVASFARKGRGGLLLRAKWDALRAMPSMLRKRRGIQRQLHISPEEVIALMDPGGGFMAFARRLSGSARA